MIEVRLGELAATDAAALLRPVAADWTAVTPAMRRLELAAGTELEEQCRRLGELPVGSAAITGAGELAAEYMVHVVVHSQEEPVSRAKIRLGLLNGLRRLTEWSIESVAMAPLGTGAGNLDAETSAEIMIPLLLERRTSPYPARVVLVVDSEYERQAFEKALRRHLPAGIP
ncbi:MAG: macro domain-containing protein [Gemmatimonadetes bacterium]|nr:macro domain-containing protein [Gemmatimonadota bacterium]